MRAYSKSGSPDKALKIWSKTPDFAQRRNRRKTLFHAPNLDGKSRQGAPVRTRHSAASKNNRLSLAVTPQSLALPGSRGAIIVHCESDSTKRSGRIQTSQKEV